MSVHGTRVQGRSRSTAPGNLNLGAKWRGVPHPQSLRIHNMDGRMTDEQLMGKDLEGSGHGLVYVVLHVFLNGLCCVCPGGDANWACNFRGPALHEAAR